MTKSAEIQMNLERKAKICGFKSFRGLGEGGWHGGPSFSQPVALGSLPSLISPR